jgi:hypothetical protein
MNDTTFDVSGEDGFADDTTFALQEVHQPTKKKGKPISATEQTAIVVSTAELDSATMLVASLERSRIEPHRNAVAEIETCIAALEAKIQEEKEKLAAKKKLLKLSEKSFKRVRARFDKLCNADISFDEFVTKLHS